MFVTHIFKSFPSLLFYISYILFSRDHSENKAFKALFCVIPATTSQLVFNFFSWFMFTWYCNYLLNWFCNILIYGEIYLPTYLWSHNQTYSELCVTPAYTTAPYSEPVASSKVCRKSKMIMHIQSPGIVRTVCSRIYKDI